jgi:predicted Zn-dependent protease with MMP-like domain
VPLKRRGRQARRQPRRRIELPAALLAGTRHEPFEDLVEQALDGLPDWAQRLLDNVAIVIEDEPTPEQLAEGDAADDPADTLYGLYEGVPATTYGSDWAQLPNKISLFRLPLEEDFPEPDELREEVRRTVLHELAHHAGIDDERLHELDLH